MPKSDLATPYKAPTYCKGTDLTPDDRRHVLDAYVHRYTGEHHPYWARNPMGNGQPYPVQFKDDREWLENSVFRVKSNGRLDRRERFCTSYPTWPNNPELRGKYGQMPVSLEGFNE